jgi:hypothetical protein
LLSMKPILYIRKTPGLMPVKIWCTCKWWHRGTWKPDYKHWCTRWKKELHVGKITSILLFFSIASRENMALFLLYNLFNLQIQGKKEERERARGMHRWPMKKSRKN